MPERKPIPGQREVVHLDSRQQKVAMLVVDLVAQVCNRVAHRRRVVVDREDLQEDPQVFRDNRVDLVFQEACLLEQAALVAVGWLWVGQPPGTTSSSISRPMTETRSKKKSNKLEPRGGSFAVPNGYERRMMDRSNPEHPVRR
jgi:hypothetical protein